MPPLTIMIKPVSGACNMRCSYCFYTDEMACRTVGLRGLMSDQTLENVIRRAFAYAQGSLLLAFQGGEPTLAGAAFFENLLRLERVYNRRGITVTHALQTNGLVLDSALLDVWQQGRFLIGVSLDGSRETHDARRVDAAGQGTYDRVLQSIAQLEKHGIDYNILCVVDDLVASQPERVFHALKRYTHLQFIPCLDPLDSDIDMPALSAAAYGSFLIAMFRQYRKAHLTGHPLSIRLFDDWLDILAGYPPGECGFFGRCIPHYLVESDGAVYPCDFFALDEWQLGNINRDSFFKLAKSEGIADFTRAQIDPACPACPWRRFCRYGCRRDRITAAAPSVSRWCRSYKLFFETCWDELQSLAVQLANRS